MTDEAIARVHQAGLKIIIAGEDDRGTWIASIATSRKAEMKTWVSGRGQSLAAALQDALDKIAMSKMARSARKAAAPKDELEDLLG